MNEELDALLKILTGREFTVTGVVLAAFIVFLVSLNREWIVTGPRYKDCKTTCDNCNTTLGAAKAELKQCETDYTTARISIVRHEEREYARQWQFPGPPTPLSPNPPPRDGGS